MRHLKILFSIVVGVISFVACQKDVPTVLAPARETLTLQEPVGERAPGVPVTQRGIVPDSYAGNFVASDDDQVCYELSALGYIGEVTGEMRGFKIDPPADYDDGYVNVDLQPGGRLLNWSTSENATLLAFVVKGGPNYNVYDYVGTGFDWDNGLGSPLFKGKIPAISHYNVCYAVSGAGQGCTPGYWRNHTNRWVGAAPGDDFDATFGVDLFNPDITLCMAIDNPQTYGVFAFHAVAALLNSYGGVPNSDGTTVDYPYSTAEVIQMVQDAVANGTLDATKNILAAANELGCPLSGTKAVKCP